MSRSATIDFLSSDTCGLPLRRAQNRFYAMLRAFIDDSGSEPQSPVFVLAGFVSTKGRWDSFTDQWDQALAGSPRKLEYFKMAEANSLRGQFARWTPDERDQKVHDLTNIIHRNAMFAVRAWLSWNIFKEIQGRYPDYPYDPYAALFHSIMGLTVRHVMALPVPEKVEFIFDEQGTAGKRVRDTFEEMKATLPQEELAYVGYEPQHRSEIEFLPLQAADMYAWHIRKCMTDDPNIASKGTTILDDIPLEETSITALQLILFFEDMKAKFPIK